MDGENGSQQASIPRGPRLKHAGLAARAVEPSMQQYGSELPDQSILLSLAGFSDMSGLYSSLGSKTSTDLDSQLYNLGSIYVNTCAKHHFKTSFSEFLFLFFPFDSFALPMPIDATQAAGKDGHFLLRYEWFVSYSKFGRRTSQPNRLFSDQ